MPAVDVRRSGVERRDALRLVAQRLLGADPMAAIGVYGEQVLPSLRRA